MPSIESNKRLNTMTVQELIEKLSKYPSNLPVYYNFRDDGMYVPVDNVYRDCIAYDDEEFVDAVSID